MLGDIRWLHQSHDAKKKCDKVVQSTGVDPPSNPSKDTYSGVLKTQGLCVSQRITSRVKTIVDLDILTL